MPAGSLVSLLLSLETSLLAGYESMTLTMPSDTFGKPGVGGGGFLFTADFIPIEIANKFRLGIGPEFFLLSSSANLEQEQDGTMQKGAFSTGEQAFGINLGITAEHIIEKFRFSVLLHYDRGIGGSIKSDIGIFHIDEVISGYSRTLLETGVKYNPISHLWTGISVGLQFGAFTLQGKNGPSFFAPSPSVPKPEIKYSGFGIYIGAMWDFPALFRPNIPRAPKTPTKTSSPKRK